MSMRYKLLSSNELMLSPSFKVILTHTVTLPASSLTSYDVFSKPIVTSEHDLQLRIMRSDYSQYRIGAAGVLVLTVSVVNSD